MRRRGPCPESCEAGSGVYSEKLQCFDTPKELLKMRATPPSKKETVNKLICGCTMLWLLIARTALADDYDTNNVIVQTFAGSGFYGYLDGSGTQTMFNNPSRLVADSASNVFVWDGSNSRIRKITPSGDVSTFAGGGNSVPANGTNADLGFGGSPGMTIDKSD